MESEPSISAIIVNYNSGLLLQECIKGLLTHLDVKYGNDEVIIVDNNSTDNSIEPINMYPEAKIVRSFSNIGYGGGCNLGYEHAGGDILLFMNPDVVLVSPAACVREMFKRDTSCAVVAHGIVEKDALCSSLRPLPTVLNDALGEIGIGRRLYRKHQQEHPIAVTQQYSYFVGYAQGSTLFVRRSAFEQAGKFDTNFFLYYEEVDLFKRLGSLGYKFIYDPKCIVKHASGGSSSALGWNKTAIRYNSKFRYFAKHTSKNQLTIHRVLMLAILSLKIILYPLGPYRSRPRRINAYIYGVRLYTKGYAPWLP